MVKIPNSKSNSNASNSITRKVTHAFFCKPELDKGRSGRLSFSTLITYVPILPDKLISFASAYKTSPAETGFIYVIFILSATAAVPCVFAAVSNASSISENIAPHAPYQIYSPYPL